tara:strand:- start:258 stop:494 length:237 start_codon:yes stop_codon:yes gene_type:complete
MSLETENVEKSNVDQASEPQEEKKDFLLSQEKFELLMSAQREIESVTEMRPTFKKLINAIVTEKAVENLKQEMIEQLI